MKKILFLFLCLYAQALFSQNLLVHTPKGSQYRHISSPLTSVSPGEYRIRPNLKDKGTIRFINFTRRSELPVMGNPIEKPTPPVPIVFYLKNVPTLTKDASMDSDREIIAELEADGFFVTEVDCSHYPASSPEFEEALMQFHLNVREYLRGLLPTGKNADYNTVIYVPEGYRVARDIPVWNIQRYGAEHILERIRETYNSYVVEKKGMVPAKSADDMIGPHGEPIDYNLYMDIIYPTGNRKVPLLLNFASNSPRFLPFNPTAKKELAYRAIFPIGFLASGYAFANMDHCYNPLARRALYQHFNHYSLDAYNGVAYATAGIRYLRSQADRFNFNGHIGVMGLSKASYGAIISANVNNNRLPERSSKYGSTDPNQPYLGYPSTVDVAYASAGDGTRRIADLVDYETVPMITSAGRSDQYGHWEVYPDVVKALSAVDNLRLDLWMEDLGHTYPGLGVDAVTGMSRYVLVKRFFDYFLKPEEYVQPQLFYILPKPDVADVNTDGTFRVLPPDDLLPKDMKGISPFDSITVRFLSPMDAESVGRHVRLYEGTVDSVAVTGTWKSSMKNSCFKFVPSRPLKPGTPYTIIVVRGAKDRKGNELLAGAKRRFVTGSPASSSKHAAKLSAESVKLNSGPSPP